MCQELEQAFMFFSLLILIQILQGVSGDLMLTSDDIEDQIA